MIGKYEKELETDILYLKSNGIYFGNYISNYKEYYTKWVSSKNKKDYKFFREIRKLTLKWLIKNKETSLK